MSGPDTDVRARGPTHARDPRDARRARLARLLLIHGREALVVLLLSASSGCVIPVVPEFKDPPEAKNYQPQIIAPPQFPRGTTLTGETQSLSLQVYDPNLRDDLVVRLVFDFPPVGPNTRFGGDTPVPNPEGKEGPRTVQDIKVNCEAGSLAPFIPVHKVTVIVADRDLVDVGLTDDLTEMTTRDGKFDEATWLYERECRPK